MESSSPDAQECPCPHEQSSAAPATLDRFGQFRTIILALFDPAHRRRMTATRFQDILDEIEHDLQMHYEAHEISLQDTLSLQMLIGRGGQPLQS